MAGKQIVGKATKRVLAAASGGGHWEQLMLLRGTLEKYDVRFATTDTSLAEQHQVKNASILPDCNQDTPFRAALCAMAALWTVARLRPDVVISTGAAPGFFCIVAGRLIGAKTLWIDSVANGEELSMCGRLSKTFAHECLTQWESLCGDPQPSYRGAVL
ncbi:glucuronosyltransferase [Erythrobacter insulae]|uniref:Glucuronosyltransferase n=1 Tax=Erythrobacter insulae TaxID=2584124 RepID=A0A547PCB6_9SPHN|nr:glucuronosyltransferase [Erythrobacter insulae]TRD11674.1 glucuronosyltransferase [Erythrobacter insulae]